MKNVNFVNLEKLVVDLNKACSVIGATTRETEIRLHYAVDLVMKEAEAQYIAKSSKNIFLNEADDVDFVYVTYQAFTFEFGVKYQVIVNGELKEVSRSKYPSPSHSFLTLTYAGCAKV